MTDPLQAKRDEAGGNAAAAGRHNGFSGIDSGIGKKPSQSRHIGQRVVRCFETLVGQILGVRHVSGTQARALFRDRALETVALAHIDNLLGLGSHQSAHIGQCSELNGIEGSREGLQRRRRPTVLYRTAFGAPLGQSTIEDRDRSMTEGSKHPPNPPGIQHVAGIVNDNAVAVSNPEAAHRRSERRGIGEHQGGWIGSVANIANIEKNGTRQVRLLKDCGDVRRARNRGVAAIDDPQIRIGKAVRQPFGGHERMGFGRKWVRHGAIRPRRTAGNKGNAFAAPPTP